jgi:fumarylacetoacetase
MVQWGVVRVGERPARPVARVDDRVVPLAQIGLPPEVAEATVLNPFIELGPAAWRTARERAQAAEGMPLGGCEPVLPVRVPDYVDFYASLEHVENFGRIFRPGRPAVHENWRHLPVAYHGRSSTVQVSGAPVRRPRGQVAPGELAPTRALDVECEIGLVCGPSRRGPIPIDEAEEHLFGAVLVNDWSARDVQRFEYVPLGPFLGKSFATGMSAWITPLDALPRTAPREQEPPPAPYLRAREPWALDLDLEIEVNGEVVSRPRSRLLYWTPAQMLAHMTVNGAALSAGDLFATGTVSGSEPGTEGSLAELWRGERWLADGDEVVLRGTGLSELRARVLPDSGSSQER